MSSEPEVLETGPPRRSRRRQVTVVVAVLLPALVLGLVAAAVERSSRDRAVAEVAACREAGANEIAVAFGRLTARTGTVRPTVFAMTEGKVRDQLLDLVSRAVSGSDTRLRAAATRCAQVEVLWLYQDLAAQRDRCAAVLGNLAGWFDRVSEDGGTAFEPAPRRGAACA